MTIYTYPLNSVTPVSIAPGADFATETTLDALNTQITNFDRNSGAAGATTLRSVLATRHEAVGTPLSFRLSDGTDFITCGAIAASQKTLSTATKAVDTVSLALGWDSITHRELLLDTSGAVRIAAADLVGMKPEYSAAFVPVLRDFSSTGLTANTWSQYIASTSAKATLIQYVNESGYPIELGFGAGGAEVSKIIMSESGELLLLIPAGTRLALRCASNVSTGNFWISALV